MGRSYIDNHPKGHPGFTALMVVLLCVGAAAVLASTSFFVVRDIVPEGVDTVSVQEVITCCGLRQGQSIFFIDQEQVRTNINKHELLYFDSMKIKFPSTVILYVREREPCAQIEYIGMMYAIDETGRVLYQSADLTEDETMPVIKGFQIKDIGEGKDLLLGDKQQLTCVLSLLDALKAANMILSTHELNVSDLENLYIMTREGAKIELGTVENLSVKIAIAQAILRDQADKNVQGAKIDVSSGEDGYFIPARL